MCYIHIITYGHINNTLETPNYKPYSGHYLFSEPVPPPFGGCPTPSWTIANQGPSFYHSFMMPLLLKCNMKENLKQLSTDTENCPYKLLWKKAKERQLQLQTIHTAKGAPKLSHLQHLRSPKSVTGKETATESLKNWGIWGFFPPIPPIFLRSGSLWSQYVFKSQIQVPWLELLHWCTHLAQVYSPVLRPREDVHQLEVSHKKPLDVLRSARSHWSINSWMDQWINEHTDEWMKEWMNTWTGG